MRLFVFLMLLPFSVMAHDIDVTWQHATTRLDGSTITGERAYIIRLLRDGQEIARAGAVDTDHSFTGLDSGAYQVAISTIEAGMVGPESAPVDVVIPFPPEAPTGLTPVVRIRIDITVER